MIVHVTAYMDNDPDSQEHAAILWYIWEYLADWFIIISDTGTVSRTFHFEGSQSAADVVWPPLGRATFLFPPVA